MEWRNLRILWGLLLVGGGLLFLLQNLNVIGFGDIAWSVLLLIGGLSFLGLYISNREHWWAIIPGIILLGLGLSSGLSALFPRLFEVIGGGFFLGWIGLAFFVVYIANRTNWWAIIPGGVLLTLSVVNSLDALGWETGGIFFLGLGLTFLLVALLPTPEGRMRWAYIPAVILGFIALLQLIEAAELMNLVVPLALIFVGLFLIFRTFRRTSRPLE
jgi:hypothetical protein